MSDVAYEWVWRVSGQPEEAVARYPQLGHTENRYPTTHHAGNCGKSCRDGDVVNFLSHGGVDFRLRTPVFVTYFTLHSVITVTHGTIRMHKGTMHTRPLAVAHDTMTTGTTPMKPNGALTCDFTMVGPSWSWPVTHTHGCTAKGYFLGRPLLRFGGGEGASPVIWGGGG